MLLICLFNCEQQKNSAMDLLQSSADDLSSYAKPTVDTQIEFPDAHQPKKAYRIEWWYLTANLRTETGQTLGTQWTLFRVAIDHKHWYFAHSALADLQFHHSAFRSGREELGNVIIAQQPFSARIDDWQWRSTEGFFPASLHYGSTVINSQQSNLIDATNQQDWQVKLQLDSQSDFFLQGQQGFNKKHAFLDIASHYYSQPFIEVSGDVYWQGSWQKVTGQAWFDREWSSQMLAADQQGWDWFSLRLDQETALMVYRIRSDLDDHLYASLMTLQGDTETLGAEDIAITPIEDADPLSNNGYPQSFHIAIPKRAIDIRVSVTNPKQIMRFGIEYFEGMVTFTGSHQGRGFLEMTGYQ